MDTATTDQHLAELRRADFEQQVVQKILRHVGLIRRIRVLKDHCSDITGSRQLTLEWIQQRFPEFPIRLGAVLVDGASIEWVDLFGRFTNNGFFRAYGRWRKDLGIDDHVEHVGIVFSANRSTWVLHNLGIQPKCKAIRIVRTVGSPPVTFVVEPLKSFLDLIGKGWAWEPTDEGE